MAKIEFAIVIAGFSAVIGLCLLLSSSLFLDDVRQPQPWGFINFFEELEFYVAATSFGIIASLIQLASFGLPWFEKWKIWSILHLVISFMCIVAFSLAINQDARKWSGDKIRTRGKVFVAFAGIDLFFSFFAAAIVFYLTKKVK